MRVPSAVVPVAILAAAAVASAQGIPWARRAIVGSAFTTEFPAGGGLEVAKPMVWPGKNGSSDQYEFVQFHNDVRSRDGDRIAVGYSDRSHDKSSLESFTGAWGDPEFLPPKRTKVGEHVATEAGWRFPFDDRMKIQLSYEIETSPGRYVYIDFNCYEGAYKKYLPIYSRMRDALRPPAKAKKPSGGKS